MQNLEFWVSEAGLWVGFKKRYQSSKLEFLGLKWAICDHFCDYQFYAEHFDEHSF